MKTTLHLHRHPAPPTVIAPRPSTLRLGLAVSFVAAAMAVALEWLVDVPAVLIVVPVVVIGFALSWHASGHHGAGRRPTEGRPD
jgi:hypothetical protein